MSPKRPPGVTLLLWLVLTMVVWGALRFCAALRGWEVLVEFESSLSPLYLAVTGAGWGVAGGVLLWSMFSGKLWMRPVIIASATIWLLQYWIERLFFQSPRANLPFAIAGSILLFSVVLVCSLHKSAKDYLTRSEEYE